MAIEKAEGAPTKKLFIDTLVRDVDLVSAIVDLVDNCVDGARRIRPHADFEGLLVRMELDKDNFTLRDNCGGIPLAVAKGYAFRFGRDEKYQGAVKHSVGHFGVGMKRTLFKIADKFTVHSVTHTDEFTLHLDVAAWKKSTDWHFDLSDVKRLPQPQLRPVGTSIQVGRIKEEIREQFAVQLFQHEVRERIRIAHSWAMHRGLKVVFNNVELTPEDLTVKTSSALKPIVDRGSFTLQDGTVSFELIAGVGERGGRTDTELSGWYVFCNGRLLLRADQTSQTGWGVKPAPSFHQQFSWFRGYLFLESDNPGLLPWNTTKTGIAEDSDVYRKVKVRMSDAIFSVTRFLNTVRDEEKRYDAGAATTKPLLRAIENASNEAVTSRTKPLALQAKFAHPVKVQRLGTGPKDRRVTYMVPAEKLKAVMDSLDAKTAPDAGLQTFNYYFDIMEDS